MAAITLKGRQCLTICAGVLLGFLIIGNWTAPTEASNPHTVIVAQNESQTAGNETKEPSEAGKQPESKTDEKKKSTGAKKKPLKDFRPSERIEAEQAVDFPYDI